MRRFFGSLLLSLALLAGRAGAQTIPLVDIATDATDPLNFADSEPSIAVNPTNPREIAVLSFAEGWTSAQAGPLWWSGDGGATWTKRFVIRRPTALDGSSGDQKLYWAQDGTLFMAQLAMELDVPRCLMYRPDGTGMWVSGNRYGDDQPMIDGHNDTILSPWLNFGTNPERSTATRSTNQGMTVATVGIGDTNAPNRTSRIAVGPNGNAYVIFKNRLGQVAGTNFENAAFRVVRSTDGGVTWNSPGVPVHAGTVQTWFTTTWGDAQNGSRTGRARSSDAWIAVNPANGDVWAAYVAREASGIGQVFAVRSTDGGLTWGAPIRVSDGTLNSAYPEIAVTANGTVGVMYLDFDPHTGAPPPTITSYTYRFARLAPNGAFWRRQTLQSFTTQELSNGTNGFLWGDYMGLTAHQDVFFGVFTGRSIGRTNVQFDPIFFRVDATKVPITETLGSVSVDGTTPHTFVYGADGNLWMNFWNGSDWAWSNQTNPGTPVNGMPGMVNETAGHAYAFVRAADTNLWVNWWTGTNWQWANQGKPATSNISTTVGAARINVENQYAFVVGTDGNLWVNWYSGWAWSWANQSKPSTTSIAAPIGAIAAGTRPHAWVTGTDGNLWLHFWNGSAWEWKNNGTPAGGIAAKVGITVIDGAKPYVFVRGNDGNLWVNYFNGATWNWANQGKPAGLNIVASVGATSINDGKIYAFVKASDGNVWVNWWSGSAWNWANQGVPQGTSVSAGISAIAVDGYRPFAYVRGADGNLWVNHWTGASWQWRNLESPTMQ